MTFGVRTEEDARPVGATSLDDLAGASPGAPRPMMTPSRAFMPGA